MLRTTVAMKTETANISNLKEIWIVFAGLPDGNLHALFNLHTPHSLLHITVKWWTRVGGSKLFIRNLLGLNIEAKI